MKCFNKHRCFMDLCSPFSPVILSKNFYIKAVKNFFITISSIVLIMAVLSCSSEDSDDNTVRVSPDGGSFKLSGGIEVDIPAGALSEDAVIKVEPLESKEVDSILTDNELLNDSMIGGFKGEMVGDSTAAFNEPVTVKLPAGPLQTDNGILLHGIIDSSTNTVDIVDGDIIYDPSTGMVELSVSDFSIHVVVEGNQRWEATFDPTWDPQSFGCRVRQPNGMITGTLTVEDDCRCGRQRHISYHTDYTDSDGCKIIRSVDKIVYADCSAFTFWKHIINEKTDQCNEVVRYSHDSSGWGSFCTDYGKDSGKICGNLIYWTSTPCTDWPMENYDYRIICISQITSGCFGPLDPPITAWGYVFMSESQYANYGDQICYDGDKEVKKL